MMFEAKMNMKLEVKMNMKFEVKLIMTNSDTASSGSWG